MILMLNANPSQYVCSCGGIRAHVITPNALICWQFAQAEKLMKFCKGECTLVAHRIQKSIRTQTGVDEAHTQKYVE